jgi:hypothetical protein
MVVTLDGVGTFAKEKLLELNWINLEKRKRFFGVLRTIGFSLDWNSALIHYALDQICKWDVYPSE